MPWDQALEQILKINNLGQQLEGNILRIAPITQLQSEAEEQQALKAARGLSVPLTTVMKRRATRRPATRGILTQGVRTTSVASVASAAAVGDQGSSMRGSVIVDARTNTLIIQELPDYMDTVHRR